MTPHRHDAAALDAAEAQAQARPGRRPIKDCVDADTG